MRRFYPFFIVFSIIILFAIIVILVSNFQVIKHRIRGFKADIVGLNRVVYLYTPFSTKPVKVYKGNIRFERRPDGSISLIVNGKKVDTNLYYVIEEK